MSTLKRWIVSVQQEKNGGEFWLLSGIFIEYIEKNIIIAVLRKTIPIQLSFLDW